MKKIKKNLKWITIVIVMITIIGGLLLKWNLENSKTKDIVVEELVIEEQTPIIEKSKEEEVILSNVYVDIKGAVVKPGVYEISEDKKVIDVVQLAGGFKENADTSMINLAKKVTNEMVIIIYTSEEIKKSQEKDSIVKIIEKECVCPEINNDACLNQETQKNDSFASEENLNDKKININNATLEELLTISGIGESKAQAIIQYRTENGNFEKIEDIMNVAGIGEALYEKIKNRITV